MEDHGRTMDDSFIGRLHNAAHPHRVLDLRLNLQPSNQ